uniref:Kinesin motor domain-containing protein n=1 Tax=Elaeophora elaphi TaxID=1147741 RepID=A0A0R3RZE7_9BILA
MDLNCDEANSTRTSSISYVDAPSTARGNPLNKGAVDFEFRFVASELEKKCHEYDRIAGAKIINAANETRKSDEKIL